MAKILTFDQDRLPYCCGIQDLGVFNVVDTVRDTYQNSTMPNPMPRVRWRGARAPFPNPSRVTRPGTGLFTVSFNHREASRVAYEQLCRQHKLLYQSPVKTNSNTRNQVFLCVFEWRR